MTTAFPLSWPTAWKRSAFRRRGPFKSASVYAETIAVVHQLELLGASTVVVSTNVPLRLDGLPKANQPNPADPGVAVYFTLDKAPRVLACDKWDLPENNLRAIAKHVEALRGQERWGVGTVAQAFAGYAALPERSSADCWKVLGLSERERAPEHVRLAFSFAVKRAHPDHGGSTVELERVVRARDEALAELAARRETEGAFSKA